MNKNLENKLFSKNIHPVLLITQRKVHHNIIKDQEVHYSQFQNQMLCHYLISIIMDIFHRHLKALVIL